MIKRSSSPRSKVVSKPVKILDSASESELTVAPSSNHRAYKAIPLFILAVVVLGGVGYWVKAYTGKSEISKDSQLQVRDGVDPKEVQNIISRVGQLVVTKDGELPTIATIQDISVLKPQNPTLYRDAENGDKLLVWSDKVIVYSANKDRILVAMPVSAPLAEAPKSQATSDSSVSSATVSEEEQATIEVRNGTPTAGLARALNDVLKTAGFKTVTPGDAKIKTYTKTMILNASGKPFPKTLATLIKTTGGTVVDKLAEEGKSLADILIIVGK